VTDRHVKITVIVRVDAERAERCGQNCEFLVREAPAKYRCTFFGQGLTVRSGRARRCRDCIQSEQVAQETP
jgi:hypothetical protein